MFQFRESDVPLLDEIIIGFKENGLAEAKSIKIYNKKSLWALLNQRKIKCLDINATLNSKEIIFVKIPPNLGDFLHDICGNSLDIAIFIMRNQVLLYDQIYEMLDYKRNLQTLIFLEFIRVQINNSKGNPDKLESDPHSNHPSWKYVRDFYEVNDRPYSIHWDIAGNFRIKNLPLPKGKKLKKKLLVGRCMLCHREQAKHTYLCEDHLTEDTTNKDKHKIERWIRDAYKHLLNDRYNDERKRISIFVKSYELHTWAKRHPVQRLFVKQLKAASVDIFSNKSKLDYKSDSKEIYFILEKALASHPYSKDFENRVTTSSGEILEIIHSLALESEHTLIKIAANPRLRNKYWKIGGQ